MQKFLSPAPVKEQLMLDNKKTNNYWLNWLNDVCRSINDHNSLVNDSGTVNPDFNWSRTKGNTATTSDGEFVEKWHVKGNGMTFAITPTYYTGTQNSSQTGSERFVNVVISAVNTNNFIIYQPVAKKLSAYQNRNITISASIKNNGTAKVKCKFHVGIDLTNSGTEDYSAESKAITLELGANDVSATINVPKITTDNQTNVVNVALYIFDLTAAINCDVFYIKPEIADNPTALVVDHQLEKAKIDGSTLPFLHLANGIAYLTPQASAPTPAAEGMMYVDSSAGNHLYIYLNGAWTLIV